MPKTDGKPVRIEGAFGLPFFMQVQVTIRS